MVRLRPYRDCDAEIITNWFKNEYAFRQWCADRYKKYPITAEDMNNYYADTDNNGYFIAMTAFDENRVIGYLTMRFTDNDMKVVRFGFVIVDDRQRGKGYGKEMLNLAIQYAFKILKVDKITLGVFENNKNAYYCYKAVGFSEIQQENTEHYNIMNESWKCIEMQLEIV
ncbi:MAG: GNAT family N-acetyltransferase [Aminipila sp.]